MAIPSRPEAGESANRSAKSMPAGEWGGQSLHLEVTAQGATLEFDCASGKMLEPLVVDTKAISVPMELFNPGISGPARKDVQPASQATLYTGTIDGDTMRVEFTLPGNSQPEGPLTPARGSQGHLRRCQ